MLLVLCGRPADSREIIISDLQREKPAWPLSSYGQKEDPCLLVGLDMSPEEMRWKAMQCQMRGDMNGYVSFEGL